ncbi:MAG: aspartate aminotransferase family protein [Magnetococcales bacterium]|nr:aspartate aminotransferase family protein [Magnetococcales bacterium]
MEKTLLGAVQLILDYLEENQNCASHIVNYRTPEQLVQAFDLSIGSQGLGEYEALLPILEEYLNHSVKTGHRQFCNQLFAGFNFPAFLGEVFTALTNTSMYTYEVAPLATLMEKHLIEKMCQLAGFPNGEGTFTTGGSNANLIALLCARQRYFPNIKEQGMQGLPPLVCFVSDQAHYSFQKAALVLGVGTDHIIEVATDDQGCMIPAALEDAITDCLASGKKPLIVAATTGTTVLGAFDPLPAIGTIAQKYDIWFHVDAAFGGSVLLSQTYAYLMDGCAQADSITWDPHKMMNIPLISSTLLVKEPGQLHSACSTDGGVYLFHEQDYDALQYELGRSSLSCGRRVDSLKLWLAWRYFGDKGYEKRINRLFRLAGYAARVIKNHNRLVLAAPPQSVTVCFRYMPQKPANLDQFTLQLRDRLVKSGASLVNYSQLRGEIVIRMVFVNGDMHETDFDQFLERVLEHGSELERAL